MKQVIEYGTPQPSQIESSAWLGEAAYVLTGTPTGHFDVQFETFVCGELGVPGTEIWYSLDNGESWTDPVLLPNDGVLILGGSGWTITFSGSPGATICGQLFWSSVNLAPPTPPTIGTFVPASGGSIARSGAAQMDVTDTDGLASAVVAVQFADGTNELVHDGTAFRGRYAGASSRSAISNGYHYTIGCADPGWPTTSILFRVDATDAFGAHASSNTYTLTIVDPVLPEPADVTSPAVTNVSPLPGAISKLDAVGFDVTDAVGFRRVIVHARFAASWEVVHDGDAFGPSYAGLSTRVAISGGFRYSIRRSGGWPSAPTIVPYAIDTSGNEAP